MIAKIYSAIPCGYEGSLVEVEGDTNQGLPTFNIVGMANKTINESKERVRSAIANSDFAFPTKKVTVNLAPAELAKDGTHLDLPIALAVLVLSGQLLQKDVKDSVFVGELSLDGELRPVRGIINIVETAQRAGFKRIFLPHANLEQASLVCDIEIIGVKTLQELFLILKHELSIETTQGQISQPVAPNATCRSKAKSLLDHVNKDHIETEAENGANIDLSRDSNAGPLLDHIRGQEFAKRAIAIAIAGHHNILLSGPPGAGKTLLARAAANLLPELSAEEKIAITKLHSLSQSTSDVIEQRPFRTPHHTASTTALLGGGANAIPGEISLAHHGVLFLDELPEYPRPVLESLRQPLEDKQITVSRARAKTTYPADFMLIATMNPCPCGYANDPTHECTCTSTQIDAYRKKLSGPLFDRIDMNIVVQKVDQKSLFTQPANTTKEHSVVKNKIALAVQKQRERYGKNDFYNSSLSSHQVVTLLEVKPTAQAFLEQAAEKLDLSARSYFKTIKVAQTIADLEGAQQITEAHITEALNFRGR